jgi:hypothetical protein
MVVTKITYDGKCEKQLESRSTPPATILVHHPCPHSKALICTKSSSSIGSCHWLQIVGVIGVEMLSSCLIGDDEHCSICDLC